MKFLFLVISMISITACSTYSEGDASAEEPIVVNFIYQHSRDDLGGNFLPPYSFDEKFVEYKKNQTSTRSLPMSYMITCNNNKSSCKHAVVKSGLNFSFSLVNDTPTLTVDFESNVGKSQTSSDKLASLTKSIPDGVDVALKAHMKKEFKLTLKKGANLNIKGPSEDQLMITVY